MVICCSVGQEREETYDETDTRKGKIIFERQKHKDGKGRKELESRPQKDSTDPSRTLKRTSQLER